MIGVGGYVDERALNILLVEDDEVDVITVKRAFATARITNRLFIARNGIEALDMLRGTELPPERRLVLLDLNMPRMNGLELLREVRRDAALQNLSIIVMTTSNEDRDRVEAYQLNVAGYIRKPISFRVFAETMAALNKYWMLMDFD